MPLPFRLGEQARLKVGGERYALGYEAGKAVRDHLWCGNITHSPLKILGENLKISKFFKISLVSGSFYLKITAKIQERF